MKTENAIKEKSKAFAIRSIMLYKYLIKEHHEYEMAKQFLRCGTSVGANVREAINAQTRADFAAKLSIAQKEAGEAAYWLELFVETGYITQSQYESIYSDCEEVGKLLTSITKTLFPKDFDKKLSINN